MARAYFDKKKGIPFFSNDRGVGAGMANYRGDVMLIQCLLKAIMHAGKAIPGIPVAPLRPGGAELGISGVWDNTSALYLGGWEAYVVAVKVHLMSTSPGPWPWSLADPFPGKVVPFTKGGKKIMNMGSMCVQMFGQPAYAQLNLPNVSVPAELAKELFLES